MRFMKNFAGETGRFFLSSVYAILLLQMVLNPAVAAAETAPVIPGFYNKQQLQAIRASALPQVRNIVSGISSIEETASAHLQVNQNREKAIVDWDSFDIGADASVHFNQQGNTNWSALNRIYDANPSQIFGSLTADGKVYLINQNGILFGKGSRVNVHRLVASSLNLNNNDFLESVDAFKFENYQEQESFSASEGVVSNHGEITSGYSGSAILIGKTVENAGTINTPAGQTALVAGEEVALFADTSANTTRTAKVVNVEAGAGTVTNYEGGTVTASGGTAGMYGRVVNQKGVIRSVSAVQRNGRIELYASDRINTGEGSVTECPVSDSDDTVHESFAFNGGVIELAGLDPDNPVSPQTGVDVVDHKGTFSATSGSINISAETRVFLDENSVVDVSGSRIELDAADLVVSAQMNSVELRDEQQQKDGILKGATVSFSVLDGSSIGDVSGTLGSEEKTALEQSLDAGAVNVVVSDGDIVAREGSLIDFSGGWAHYHAGTIQTTKLVSGNTVYDISEAPSDLVYDAIINPGESYSGSPVSQGRYIPDHYRGANGGTVNLVAESMALEGRLDGSVTIGHFQDKATELTNAHGNVITDGRARPAGSILRLGISHDGSTTHNSVLRNALITRGVVPQLGADFQADDVWWQDPDSNAVTLLSDAMLSDSGVGHLEISTNEWVETLESSHLDLEPGSSMSVFSRRIIHRGDITLPSGSLLLKIDENATSFIDQGVYQDVDERIYLASGSGLSVAGERADNSDLALGGGVPDLDARIGGGSVTIQDATTKGDGVLFQTGAVINVDGGYEIDSTGSVSGGDAGSIEIQGSTILLNGDISGLSLAGSAGGRLSLHANNVIISEWDKQFSPDLSADEKVPDEIDGYLILGADKLTDSGFAEVEINSRNDIDVSDNVVLSTSYRKMRWPVAGQGAGGGMISDFDTLDYASKSSCLSLLPDTVGETSMRLSSGTQLKGGADGGALPISTSSRIALGEGSTLAVSTGGSIELSGTNVLLSGTIEALSGTIDVEAASLMADAGARILAGGAVRNDTATDIENLNPGLIPMDAGSVSLKSSGDLEIENGALIDVSGVGRTGSFMVDTGGIISDVSRPGRAGDISLTFAGDLRLDGDVRARNDSDINQGGSLTLLKSNATDTFQLSSGLLSYLAGVGFDDITLAGHVGIDFTSSVDLAIGQHLTFDAPVLRGGDDVIVGLQSPWVTLTNSVEKYSSADVAYASLVDGVASGGSNLEISAASIDISGKIALSGFGSTVLSADGDIRFSDLNYTVAKDAHWLGGLEVSGDLAMLADRIYPRTDAQFTVTAAEGNIITYGPDGKDLDLPVSAGGGISLFAENIYHAGNLYAPLGTIALTAGETGRVHLDKDSVLSVGSDQMVYFGKLAEEYWTILDKEINLNTEIALPEKSIVFSGGEVVIAEGAVIDAAGGGGIFSYYFLPGIEGSVNPLEQDGTYVILPDNNVSYPGEAVYITGDPDLAEGYYTLLPSEYAFMSGAKVLTTLEEGVAASGSRLSPEGYDVVFGYGTEYGTKQDNAVLTAYSIRDASDVLGEGNFTISEIATDTGGSIAVSGNTVIVQGELDAAGVNGADGGRLFLAAGIIDVLPDVQSALDVQWGRDLDDSLIGTLSVPADIISGGGFKQVTLGSEALTDSVTVQDGVLLEAGAIEVAAGQEIFLAGESVLAAEDDENGSVSLIVSGGNLAIAGRAAVRASDTITLSAANADIDGDIEAEAGRLNIISDRIFFSNTDQSDEGGFIIDASLLERFGSFDNLAFTAAASVSFSGDIALSAPESISINTPLITGAGSGDAALTTISSGLVSLYNSGGASGGSGAASVASLRIAGDQLMIGHGDLLLEGFSDISFAATDALIFKGKGSLTTTADTVFGAPVLTADYYELSDGIESSDFLVDAGMLRLAGVDAAPASLLGTLGGNLTLRAGTLEVDTRIDVGAGDLALYATGSGIEENETSVTLLGGAELLARGNDYVGGGNILLGAATGDIVLSSGALMDVSAGSVGNAGGVSFLAGNGLVDLSGTLQGSGGGGEFSLAARRVDDASGLLAAIGSGGFDGAIDLRITGGDFTIAASDVFSARQIAISADAGAINHYGSLLAESDEGRNSVSLFAGEALHLHSGSRVVAAGSGDETGQVSLASSLGTLSFDRGATIDVSSAGTDAAGGKVSFRALRNGYDLRMALSGHILGADGVAVEANRVYAGIDSLYGAGSGSSEGASLALSTLVADAESYMANLGFTHALTGVTSDQVVVMPAMEIRSDGDLRVDSALDLSDIRFGSGSAAGALTLRAAGNLEIAGNIIDGRGFEEIIQGVSNAPATWRLQLVAGADLGAADDFSTINGQGILSIDDSILVYTENAGIGFASGADTIVGKSKEWGYMVKHDMRYSLGSYYGDVIGAVGGDLSLNAGMIQTALGDVELTVGGALDLKSSGGHVGSIRTTGEAPVLFSSEFSEELQNGFKDDPEAVLLYLRTGPFYWAYKGGGDIELDVRGAVYGNLGGSLAWDYIHVEKGVDEVWSASYGGSDHSPTEGIAAMGGGNVLVHCGGDFLGPVGTFGTGDLTVQAGGDVDGRFLAYDGTLDLYAGGSFGSRVDDVAVELFDVDAGISAQGDILVGTIASPTLVRDFIVTKQVGYSEATSIRLSAITGDITLSGVDAYSAANSAAGKAVRVLPGAAVLEAGGDINILSDFAMVSAQNGVLGMHAGNNITGSYVDSRELLATGSLVMADLDLETVYDPLGDYTNALQEWSTALFGVDSHAGTPVHEGDASPVLISAGNDIDTLKISLPKQATITAGHDIINFNYSGQNLTPEDVTTISAGNDIRFVSSVGTANSLDSLIQGGPGTFLIQAGGSVDLGSSKGIQTTGASINRALADEGSKLLLVSGYMAHMSATEAEDFFAELTEYGKEYSELLAEGKIEEAEAKVEEARNALLVPLLGDAATGGGDIDMINSKISTTSEGADIFLFSAGDLNVGRSTISSGSSGANNSGIFTESGGSISICSVGDININESRTMTFRGGDIRMWTDQGNINAGRGSKTAISTPEVVYKENDDGTVTRTFKPPSVGSGIRALTYDPDGIEGPLIMPDTGDLYLFAPEGEIDAGEAGIAGGDIFLGARRVKNVQNIDVGGVSVGVPDVSGGGAGIGTLSGAGGLSETSSFSEETALGGSPQDRFSKMVEALSDSLVPKWLAVEVIGFVEEDNGEQQKDDDIQEKEQ